MSSFADAAVASAYFLIPLLLIPLLRRAKQEIWINLILAVAFVFSCGVGHLLEAIGLHLMPWHWLTAAISWAAVITLYRSQHSLRYISQMAELLQASWEESITGKMLLERDGNDLRLLKINSAASELLQNQLNPGDLLCQQVPAYYQPPFPYQASLIELYLQALETGQSQRLQFQFLGGSQNWHMSMVTPLSPRLLYITFQEMGEIIHDPLTGIFNRRILDMPLKSWEVCLYIDLDHFKLINDQRGHSFGDRVLKRVAEVLQNLAQQHGGIALRDGGDEFLLMLGACGGEPYHVAVLLLEQIQALSIEGIGVSASIGVAASNEEALKPPKDTTQLRQAAETAAREAKQDRSSDQPSHRIRMWDLQLAQQRERSVLIESHLFRCDYQKEFHLVYQPICRLEDGAIVGAEALIRWNSPHLGSVPPDEFIPIAEASNLISSISDWVIDQALEQLQLWHSAAPDFTVSVNISPIELDADDALERLSYRLSQVSIPHHKLGLEITERGIYRNLENYKQSLQSLQAMGLLIKLDDFGIGQSGLSQLLQFPFDEVKVDRSFIPTEACEAQKIAICQAVTTLAKGLHFRPVAEGIETAQQRDLMIQLGYTYGQGYFFAKPMASEQLMKLLTANVQQQAK